MMRLLSKFFVLLAFCLMGGLVSSCEEEENHQGQEMLRIYMGMSEFYGEGAEGEIIVPFTLSDIKFKPTVDNLVFGISSSTLPGGIEYRPEWKLSSVMQDDGGEGSWLAIFHYKTQYPVTMEGFLTIRGKQVQASAVTVQLKP